MSNYYSYMRISTKEERGKQRFTRQEASLKHYAKQNGIEYVFSFQEDVSGKNFKDRKEWNRLEKILQAGDTIVFKDISRFTREAENGYNKYMDLMEKGINLVFLSNPTVSTDYIKNLLNIAEQQALGARTALESTIKLLLIVELDRVEQERLIISQRTKDGLRASSRKSGRKAGSIGKMTDALKEDLKLYNTRRMKGIEIMKKHGISRNTLKKYAELIREGA